MIAISPRRVLRAVAVGVVACVTSVSLWGFTQGGAVSGDAEDRDRGRPTPGVVVQVVDGDTVRVRIDGPAARGVRLLGVDAPEVPRSPEGSAECYGQKSTRALAELLPRGSKVTLEADPSQDATDSYGRLLRYLTIGGIDSGETQIKTGAAVARPGPACDQSRRAVRRCTGSCTEPGIRAMVDMCKPRVYKSEPQV